MNGRRNCYIKVESMHQQHITQTAMEHRASMLWIALLSLLGSGLSFQEKSSLQSSLAQARSDNLQQTHQQLPVGSIASGGSIGEESRSIDDNLMTSINKAGISKHFVGSGTKTSGKPAVHHPPQYYYPLEGSHQHGLSGGYPWSGYSQPPPRPWYPSYNTWPYGWSQWYPGNNGFPGGFVNPGFPGNSGFSGFPGYPGPGFAGFPGNPGFIGFPRYAGYPGLYFGNPGFPFFRSSENEEIEPESGLQSDLTARSIPGSYQARLLASSSNYFPGKSTGNILPLYQLLNVARV